MRISDWSSDVFSSDLPRPTRQAESEERLDFPCGAATGIIRSGLERIREPTYGRGLACLLLRSRGNQRSKTCRIHRIHWAKSSRTRWTRSTRRSEEHTSELQSLMRTSYAVFCLKKKIHYDTTQSTRHITTT